MLWPRAEPGPGAQSHWELLGVTSIPSNHRHHPLAKLQSPDLFKSQEELGWHTIPVVTTGVCGTVWGQWVWDMVGARISGIMVAQGSCCQEMEFFGLQQVFDHLPQGSSGENVQPTAGQTHGGVGEQLAQGHIRLALVTGGVCRAPSSALCSSTSSLTAWIVNDWKEY